MAAMGFNSKIVVTGDMTQVDLPRTVRNGLADAVGHRPVLVLSGLLGTAALLLMDYP